MELLFVCRFLPHPAVRDSGGQDVYHYISSLSERHSVSLIAFVTAEQQDALAAMHSICRQVVAVPYSPHALLPRLGRALCRVFLPRVYGRVVSLRYRRSLRALLSRVQFDVVIVDGMMAQYGRWVREPKKVLDEIDVYSLVAYHTYQNERHLLARLWAGFDWLRLHLFELRYLGSYDAVLVRSERDREIVRAYLPWQRVEAIAPWFEGLDDLSRAEPSRPEGNRLLFVGAMNLPKNVEAVLYFVRQVLPLIRRQVPDVELYIVGSAPTSSVCQLAAEQGVIVTGEVQELTPYYERCAVNVVPLLTGGGIIVKTLNGMAAGRPTVATPVGNSGTGARPGRDLVVVDCQPEMFARAVVRLLTDQELWERIAIQGRAFVASHYNWDEVTGRLESFLGHLQNQAL